MTAFQSKNRITLNVSLLNPLDISTKIVCYNKSAITTCSCLHAYAKDDLCVMTIPTQSTAQSVKSVTSSVTLFYVPLQYLGNS